MTKQRQMNRSSRPLIGLAVDASTSYGRQIVRGVMRFAEAGRKWSFMEDFRRADYKPEDWARCDAVIVDARTEEFVLSLQRLVGNVVCCAGGLPLDLFPTVCLNEPDVGALAVEHFMERGIKDFAYYALAGQYYLISERRLEGYRRALAARQFKCSEFRLPRSAAVLAGFALSRMHWPALSQWLKVLPKPVGMLATDDQAARDLLTACYEAGIAVPDDVALIGVNNDELLCETAWPPLSSIDGGFDRVGYAAARLVDEKLTSGKAARTANVTLISPLGVVRRASTDTLAINDVDLVAAMRYIRAHACDPCTVGDVVFSVAVGRRRLEKRWFAKLGTTLHEQIIYVRLDTAKRLLLRPGLDINDVAQYSGFSTTQLNRVFLKSFGQTPSVWRQTHID